jgi:hypothetical protein
MPIHVVAGALSHEPFAHRFTVHASQKTSGLDIEIYLTGREMKNYFPIQWR